MGPVGSLGVDSLFLPKGFRGTNDQRVDVIDNPADVIGDRSGGIRGMGAFFKSLDFQLRAQTPGLRSRAHPRGISSDYNQSFFGHLEFSFPRFPDRDRFPCKRDRFPFADFNLPQSSPLLQ